MSSRRRAADILKDLTNIEVDVSGDENEKSDLEDEEFEIESDDDDSENENEDSIQQSINAVIQRNLDQLNETEKVLTAKDGTVRKKVNVSESTMVRNRVVFTVLSGTTNYAKSRVNITALSAFLTIFDDSMIKLITNYSNMEADSKNDDLNLE
jgi:hypothetical protein